MNSALNRSVVMIADVSGSTSLYEKLSEREAEYAVERCIRRIARAIDAYRGRTLRIVGDELLACFSSAEDACLAAIDMQQRITALPPISGLKLGIRVALHHGAMTADDAQPVPEALASLVRIVGLARQDQILCSQPVFEALPASDTVHAIKKPELGTIQELGESISLLQVHWPALTEVSPQHSMFGPMSTKAAERLRITYLGRSYMLDEHTPVISLGRDPACELLISDRKASRTHARIERRIDGFYLIDTSTNGSFVTIGSRQEVMVRRHEVLLEKQGIVCFGSSANDTAADRIHFEHC